MRSFAPKKTNDFQPESWIQATNLIFQHTTETLRNLNQIPNRNFYCKNVVLPESDITYLLTS